MSKLVIHPQTLRALQIALKSALTDVQGEHRKVTIAGQRVATTIDDAIRVRQAKVEQCRLALDRCLASERDSCAAEAAALAEAERRLAAAHAARGQATQAIADYQSQANASLKRLELTHSQGLRYLSAKLDKVLAVSAGGASGIGGGGATTTSSLGATALRSAMSAVAGIHRLPGMPSGSAMIPVGLIDQTEAPINGSQDFGKGYSIEDLDYAFELFESQILPGLASGANAATFSAQDHANRVFGTRSLSDTFSGFFGHDAIKLDPLPGGTFHIANGRHRVYVASLYGRQYVPAFISASTP
jgi:hypothetical protein